MIVLSIETITRAGSLAIVRDEAAGGMAHGARRMEGGSVIASAAGTSTRTHAERLPGEAIDFLRANGLTLEDVTLFAVVSGPGSFTGIRVGMAAVQGLAFSGRQRTIGVGSLEATVETWLARPADPMADGRWPMTDTGLLICPCIDAARGEVYFAIYEAPRDAATVEECRPVMGPGVAAPARVTEIVGKIASGRPVVFVGDGAVRYEGEFKGLEARGAGLGEGLTAHGAGLTAQGSGLTEGQVDAIGWPVPLAEGAARIAARRHAEAGPPHALRPTYVRRPDVELARERQTLRTDREEAGPTGVAVRTEGKGAGPTNVTARTDENEAGPTNVIARTDENEAGPTSITAATAENEAGPMMSIVRAASTDIEAVERLQRLTFSNPWGAEAIRWELDNTDVARLYVMRDAAGALTGYCACWVVFDELHINSLAIDPTRRRRGLARHLLRHVLAAARAEGATSSTLEVRASNLAARQLYEGLGFAVEAVRRDYYQQPREDAIILWKRGLEA